MNKNQRQTNPPLWATKLLRWWADPNTLEETEGDLLEMYAYWQKTAGQTRAKWLYVLTAMKLLRPFAQHKRAKEYPGTYFFSHDMIQNYFKIAFRNLVKSKTFSAINVLGLALGMACSLLIMLWIKDELSVDGFHANKSTLYRIYMREYFSGKVQGVIWTPGPLAEELKKSVPEIEMATPYEWPSSATFAVGDKIHKQQVNAAHADFFKMFSFKMLQGTPESALTDPNGLAISRNMAVTFFGSPEAALGKPIKMDDYKDMMVTAVFENIDQNSTLKFDCLRNWDNFLQNNGWANEWGNTDPLTFFKIRADANPAKVEAKIKHLLDKFNRDNGKPFRTQLAMQPFHEYYLNSNIKDAQMDGGRIEYVRLFGLVAVFILLIACINFMNLATARSAKRAKEVGVRKVIGAMRSMLVGQFMGEAILITLLSIILAILLVAILLPSFNNLTGKQILLPLNELNFWLTLSGLLLTTGLLAGSYPAFFLSSLNPIRVLKGALKFDAKSAWLRQGLVVFQFGLSIIMIVGMITIYRQVDFIQSKNLGYDRENLVYFPLEGDLIANYDLLRNALLKVNGVKLVSHMTESPGSNGSGTEGITWPGSDANGQVRFTPVGVGYDFAKTMKLELAAGRDFSKDFATDSAAFLINETALKVMGFKDPIGKTLKWGNQKGVIVGVLKDFHFQSLHQQIRPLISYMNTKNKAGNVIIRIDGGNTKETLAGIEQVCKTINPKFPFTYSFTDQAYAKQYQSEQIVSKLSDYFAFIAIFIPCLGLFGLATFTAEQRTKEIGVRKVLGASVSSIVGLLSKDFLKPVAAAIVIACPVAWWLMNSWLEGFAYRVDIAWWIFVLAGVAAVLIAVLTVSFQSIKAALLNPVKSLRSE